MNYNFILNDGYRYYLDEKYFKKDLCIVVACEESQEIASRFYLLGYEVYSVDIQKNSNKEYDHIHLQSDIMTVLNTFKKIGKKVDCLIGFPPCNFLSHFAYNMKFKDRCINKELNRELSSQFFLNLWNVDRTHDISHICLENPKGHAQTLVDDDCIQCIQPYEHGEYASKKTYLHSKRLPKIEATEILTEDIENKGKFSYWFNKQNTSKQRSKTFKGIASAIVDQYDMFFSEIYGFTKEYNFKTYDDKFDQCNSWLYEKTIQK